MKVLNEQTSIEIKRLEYILANECLHPNFKDKNGETPSNTNTSIEKDDDNKDVIKVFNAGKEYLVYPGSGTGKPRIFSLSSGITKTFPCNGIEGVDNNSNNNNNNNGGGIPFCIKSDNGVCTEFDLDKVVTSLGELKNNHGEIKPYTKRALRTSNGKLYLKGESRVEDGRKAEFELKYDNDIWYFEDPEKDGGSGWIPFSEYFTTSLHEQNIKPMKNKKSLSDMIEDKLRDVYFYSISEKGKERIKFDLEDKRNILQHLKDLANQNINGDKGFVMSVVRSKGEDKDNEHTVKLGSYPKDSNIDLGFEEKGLSSLLGTQYFSIKNNDGPDERDFEIVKGDIHGNIEFKKEKKDEVKEPINVVTKPVKEEPYEEVMKQKESKGLSSLVDTDNISNDLTKKQKEIVEKLKGQGYLFKRPVEDSEYNKKRVKSAEFVESFNVWEKKK